MIESDKMYNIYLYITVIKLLLYSILIYYNISAQQLFLTMITGHKFKNVKKKKFLGQK